jgi:hypothetical protein
MPPAPQIPAQQDVYGYQPQEAYAADGMSHTGGYGAQVTDPYAAYQEQGYDPQQYAQQDPYAYQQPQPQPQAQQGAALDETSLFDTSMIDMEQLRRYEQGR